MKSIFRKLDKFKEKVGTKTYNLSLAIIALCMTILGSAFGGVYLPAILGLLASIFNNVAIFLVVIFSLQFFQGGSKLNIQKKIFDDGNVAAAIYQGAIVIAIAMLISGALV